MEVNDRLNKTWSLFSPTVSLMTEVGLLVVWGFGIWLVSRNQITVGCWRRSLPTSGAFTPGSIPMSRIVSVTQKAAAGAKRIFDIPTTSATCPTHHPVKVDKVEGAIEMRDIGFRYGSRTVVRNLSLQIRPGEMIGLVGHSGSGKSTLVNLISRFTT